MNRRLINEQRKLRDSINAKWLPILEQKLGDKAHTRNMNKTSMAALAHMCHVRAIFESNATPDSVPGRGAFGLGNNPGAGPAGFYGAGAKGSAEVYQNLFGVFIELYANTIGFDLVPTVPQDRSSGSIYIAEPIYADGRLNSADNKPLMIHVKPTLNGAAAALVVGTDYTLKTANAAGEDIAVMTFVGKHRLNGNFIFKVGAQNDNTGGGGTDWTAALVKDLFDSASNGSGIYTNGTDFWSFDAATVDYVAGFTNFVAGFSGAGLNDTDAWFQGRQNGLTGGAHMGRNTGERHNSRSMGIRTWHKNWRAGTVKVDIEYTQEQIQDMEHDLNLSALELGDTILMDQASQHINDHILSEIFALGWQHHYDMNQANGFNMNLNYDVDSNTSTAGTYRGADGSALTIAGVAGALPSSGAISENLSSLQRRLVSRLTYGSNVINNKSRRGRGDCAVMNTRLVSALQDVRGYTPAPYDSDLSYNGLAMVGKFNGIAVYEDTMMGLDDPRVAVFRKGTEKDPGLKFCPYILAEKVETIAESTMAPKTQLTSRYSLVHAGSEPALNYLTFTVAEDGFQLI